MVSSLSRPQLPVQDGYVFVVAGSSLIDAPAERVWNTLLDFQSYKLWNPFVRNQVITDSRKNPLPDQTPYLNRHVHMNPVHLPPTLDDASVGMFNKSSALCVITALDHQDFKVAWCTHGIPSWILWTERWQWLTHAETDLGDGKGRKWVTRYDSVEAFGGFAAYFVKWFIGGKLNLGFQAQADGLKRRAEMDT